MTTTRSKAPTSTRKTPTAIAQLLIDTAERTNWKLSCNPDSGSISVTRIFTKGDIEAYMDADNSWGEVLSLAPMTRSGSGWGTDSASVGGAVGLDNGYYRMNKSGISKTVIAQLQKLGVRKTVAPIKGLIAAATTSSLFLGDRATQTTPTKEGDMTTPTPKPKAKGKTSKASASTRTANARVAVTKTPTEVSPVSSTADVDRIKALFASDGTAAGRVEACRIAALEGAAKKEALKSGAPRPPMPVNEWMASDDYQNNYRRNSTMSTSTPGGTGAGRSTTAAKKSTGTKKSAGGAFPNCPLCGHKFSTPKAKCSSKAACEKRQAAAKGGSKAAPAAKKSAPAKAAAPTSKAKAASKAGPKTFKGPIPKGGTAKKSVAAKASKPAARRVTKRTAA